VKIVTNKRWPATANPYDSRAEMYAQDGKLDQAIESYQKALAIDPEFHSSRAGQVY
jgi:Tfp pilus assembly protein PilF